MMISIQRARPEQAEQLTQIARAAKAHWGYPQRWMEIWEPQLTFTADYLAGNEGWVAAMDGVPVAFSILLEKDGKAWLEDLWVLPACMGTGIGKALFQHAVEQARRRGFRLLQLVADPHAVGFYEKMGMHRVGERRSEVDGQPRVLPLLEIRL